MESLAPDHIDHRWVLDKGEVALISVFGDDKLIADTARVSYRKGTKQVSSDKQLVRYLIHNKHHSPLEHASIRWYVKMPLFSVQQLLRHRTFKFNQSSARYSEMLEEAYVPLPEHITTQDAKNRQARTNQIVDEAYDIASNIEIHNKNAFDMYNTLLKDGVAREISRIILPHGTYSELIVTTDLRNFLHFLSLRMHPHAQWEIRAYAEAMYEMAKPLFPAVFEAWDDTELKSFKLTGLMQEALAMAIHMSTCYDDWKQCASDAADKFHWESKSERDQFISWCNTLQIK